MRRLFLLTVLLLSACVPLPVTAIPTRVNLISLTPLPSVTPPSFEPTLTSIGRSPSATPAATATPTAPVAIGTGTPAPAPGTASPLGIQWFTASPSEIRPGDTIALNWSASAEQVTLYQLSPSGQLGLATTVAPSGTLDVPTSTQVRNRVSFMLFANTGGASASAYAAVRVICPDVYFFDNPPDSCPQSPPVTGLAVMQRFERGRMFWLSWNRLIYLLFDDGQIPDWSATVDTWQEGLPESDPGLTPPPGLQQPVRGFGLVWRDQTNTYLRVRDRMGWAVEAERSFDAAFQCDSPPKYVTCYLRGPDGAVHVLEPESSGWYIWTGPTPVPGGN